MSGFLARLERWFKDVVLHEDYATVVVVKGDSLWNIAADITGHGTDWTKIAELNDFDEHYTIRPGDIIRVPLEWAQ